MNIWQGKNIRLRGVELSDLDNYFWTEKDKIDTDADRASWRIHQPPGRENYKKVVEDLAAKDPLGDEYFYILESNEGKAVGNLNIHDCDRRNGTFSYGLSIRTEYRKKGYAREAIGIVLNVYFNEYNFNKVNVDIYDFNEASLALHRKMGFTEEGCRRQNQFAAGKYCDVYLFGMTREEFNEKA
jgi:RimJ/RimL family protein N-acetyltransferase